MKGEKETEVEIRAYTKSELAALYRIRVDVLHKWLNHWKKELIKLKYNNNQKILTVAQVRFLFRDDVLGKP